MSVSGICVGTNFIRLYRREAEDCVSMAFKM